ncbi:PREDICTED: short-chain dehydrogenase/reductase family 16C member 6-like isoform X1 [Polistes canadensis]|uniref:short-chain dehydrogenase/reductase family 16C member 6-like isoform X1 n=1 Tax=Polistes canadensis TaxID=91411 RepID=UPI000718D15B|nr:PREDICTED: short-chain dehydrogenase/reductase family 16C member 6-like isoform X1 [Polistes canadensis]
MFIRLYSLFVLALDLITLSLGICFTILVSLYRTIRPLSLKSLNGEIAIVVGAGRGVGKEIAIQLSQLGVTVACVDINAENCKATVLRAIQLSGNAKSYICDVTNEDQVTATVTKIVLEMGEITMLFHCCGFPSPHALIRDPPKIRQTIDISVLSHFWLLESVLPSMKRAERGHIVALSSVAGLSAGFSGITGGKGCIPLSAAQFAIQGLAESLHTELRHSNSNIIITLVHIYPFVVGVELVKDIRFRIPSYFGTMVASEAAKKILNGVRRNYTEFSIPGYLLYIGLALRMLPKKVSFMLRDLLDTGVDFG